MIIDTMITKERLQAYEVANAFVLTLADAHRTNRKFKKDELFAMLSAAFRLSEYLRPPEAIPGMYGKTDKGTEQ